MQSARGFEYGVKHIISPQSGPELHSVTETLQLVLDFPLDLSLALLNLGAIYVNNRRISTDELIAPGTYLRVHSKPRRFPSNDGNWSERIVFQNEYFIVANKPSGLPVHSSVDNIRENVQAYLEAEVKQTLYVTHRLDVPTRGLIVYAKTKEFQSAFNKILIAREIKKIYRARVHNSPPLGVLTHYMESSPRAPKKVDRHPHPDWQECILEILSQEKMIDESILLKIQLQTGRTHQIRAQLGFEQCPIIGDQAYGAPKVFNDDKIELQACELQFSNPLTQEQHHFLIKDF